MNHKGQLNNKWWSLLCGVVLALPCCATESSQDGVYALTENIDKLQQPYIEKARNTYPQAKERFLNGFPNNERFYLTVKLHDTDGEVEMVFVAVNSIVDGKVSGVIANKIMHVKEFKKGQLYSFPESDLMDWTIVSPDGTEEGNVVGKFMEEYQLKLPAEIALHYANANAEAEKLGAMLFDAESRDQILDSAMAESAKRSVTDYCKFRYNAVQIRIDNDVVTYVLGFSNEKGSVVFGRHYKFSPSGKSVSTVSCYETGKSREKPVALVITQLVAPSPTEFQVFLSLKYRIPIYVGTSEGTWLVSGGKIQFSQLR